jgi:hypothetical protein
MCGIRTCRGGPSVPFTDAPLGFRPSVRPSSLPPPPTRLLSLSISNRESLRLEINVTQTKQTPEPHSNRELEALFQVPINWPSSSRQIAFLNPRKPPANSKNKKSLPSFMFRLETTPILCFVGVKESFNRTMFRLTQLAKRMKSKRVRGSISLRKGTQFRSVHSGGRVDCSAIAQRLTRRPYTGKNKGRFKNLTRNYGAWGTRKGKYLRGIFPQSSTGLHRLRVRILLTLRMERFILRAD